MTFISLILNIVNAFSFWHGITVLGLLDTIINRFNERFSALSVIKLIICKKAFEFSFKVILKLQNYLKV